LGFDTTFVETTSTFELKTVHLPSEFVEHQIIACSDDNLAQCGYDMNYKIRTIPRLFSF
jgi:hypothetical protein